MGGYPAGSRIAELEKRAAEAAARVEAARARHGGLSSELRAVEDAWANANAENCDAAKFAELSARRELLLRSQNRARQDLAAMEAAAQPAQQAYAQASRSLIDARDRLARAEYRGDTATMRACSAQLAGLLEVDA
jgi:chemotaxis regulatin CheY-phosphate phosphatase CheZ